jgi:multidrug transporter EmrE-like cation transporter
MYFRYMSIAFVTNGLGVFGLRILAAAGLANTDTIQYLTIWYLAGTALALLAWLGSAKLLPGGSRRNREQTVLSARETTEIQPVTRQKSSPSPLSPGSGKLLPREWMIGGAMAVCSLCGQLGMARALAGGLPGYVVFPVATGGGLLFVVAAGVSLFRERIGAAGYLGIAVGTIALILLALPG